MAKKKVAPNMASAPAESTASDPVERKAHAPAESTPPAQAKSTASAPAKSTPPALEKNAVPSSSKNPAPSSSKNKASYSSPSKNEAPSSAKNKAPVAAKNKAPLSGKNTPPAPVNNTPSAPDKNTASSPNKKAAPKWWQWQGILDAFLAGVQGTAGDNTSGASRVPDTDSVKRPAEEERNVVEEAPTEGSTSAQKEALTEGSTNKKRDENQSWLFRETNKTRQQVEKEALTDDSTNQEQRKREDNQDKTKKQDEVLPPPLMVSGEFITPDLVDRYADYCQYRLSCPWGKTVCQVCVIEDQKFTGYRFPDSKMIRHCKDKHQILSGLPCKERDCRVIVRNPCELALHAYFCHDLDSGWWWKRDTTC